MAPLIVSVHMRAILHITLTLFGILVFYSAMGQSQDVLNAFNQSRYSLTQDGMTVLGTWAMGNIGVGLVGMAKTSGETKAFHQMNAMWNVINLTLAVSGYLQHSGIVDTLSLSASYDAQFAIEKLLLVNTGLDLGYVATGFYLVERGRRKGNARLRGFGKALWLQGSFLFLFDGIFYWLQHQHYLHDFPKSLSIGAASEGIGFCLQF